MESNSVCGSEIRGIPLCYLASCHVASSFARPPFSLLTDAALPSPGHTEDARESFMWYVEFLAKAAEGDLKKIVNRKKLARFSREKQEKILCMLR